MRYNIIIRALLRAGRIFLCNIFRGKIRRKQMQQASARVYFVGISFAYFFQYRVFDIAESSVSELAERRCSPRMKTNFKN